MEEKGLEVHMLTLELKMHGLLERWLRAQAETKCHYDAKAKTDGRRSVQTDEYGKTSTYSSQI